MAGTAVAMAVLLAACGNAGSDADTGTAESSPTTAPSTIGACAADDAAITGARDIATLDLDGDGDDEDVRLATQAPCEGTLFTTSGDEVWTAEVIIGAFTRKARVITRPGESAELLLVTQPHPRGGFQPRLYGAADGSLGELLVNGQPLLGFVATDVELPGSSARCGDGGSLVVTTAAPTDPPGVVMAYDVFQREFTLDGLSVTAGERTRVAHSVPDTQMHKRYPEVVAHSLFSDCAR